MGPRSMTPFYLLTLAALAFGGFAYATVGFGIALVASPFLVAEFGSADGVRVSLILATGLGLIAVPQGRRHLRLHEGSLMLAPALLLSPLIAVLVRDMDGPLLVAIAGTLTLLGVWALHTRLLSARLSGDAGAVTAGAVSAGMNVVAGLGGPPLALYTAGTRWPIAEARSTMQTVFVIQNVIALFSLGLTPVPVPFMVALVIGWVGGMLAAKRVAVSTLRTLALSVAGIGGILAVVRGLAEMS